ncbi:MAG: hypothetical protein LUD69_03520 [Oscillospiraceae bacterium]|nr:hypothetical protein [Oscillospiraceae bacterium]
MQLAKSQLHQPFPAIFDPWFLQPNIDAINLKAPHHGNRRDSTPLISLNIPFVNQRRRPAGHPANRGGIFFPNQP